MDEKEERTMKDLWTRFKRWIDGSDRAAARREYFESRMKWHREDVNRRRVAERAELRDRFAGYALIGLLAAGDHHAYNRDEMAGEAWKQADAMMEERGND
jgi:hypothetical protein